MTDHSELSPRLESELEELNYQLHMAEFDPARHLNDREDQYVHGTHDGISIVRETEDGWCRESIPYKSDVNAQIEKLKNDKTVVVGWFSSPRFNSKNGGWS